MTGIRFKFAASSEFNDAAPIGEAKSETADQMARLRRVSLTLNPGCGPSVPSRNSNFLESGTHMQLPCPQAGGQ
jgi:hypothetical protein